MSWYQLAARMQANFDHMDTAVVFFFRPPGPVSFIKALVICRSFLYL